MLKNIIIVIILSIAVKLSLDIYFNVKKDDETSSSSSIKSTKSTDSRVSVYTPQQLKEMNRDNRYFLAILGNVYDVTKGEKHYKPGGSYDFFTGKDASRSFVTGDFKNDLNDKIDDLSDAQVNDIFNWKNFFDTTYVHVGVVIGRFFDKNGKKTEYYQNVEKVLEKHKEFEKVNVQFSTRFPSCNSEWTQEKGLVKVWCTNESGGIKRSWSGHPRLVYNSNTKVESCACVNENDLDHPNVKPYVGCDKFSTICYPKK